MDLGRRLGAFSLVLAFFLYVFYEQSDATGLEWRGQLLAYSVIFGILGIILLFRFRRTPKESSRFSGFKDFLYRSSSKSKTQKRGKKRGKSRKQNEEQGE